MKKFLFLFLLTVSLGVSAQSIKVSTKLAGTTVSTSIPVNQVFNLDVKTPKTEQQQIGKSIPTSNTAIYKNNTYIVYQTEKGKMFIVYPNKEMTGYNKKYIPQQ